MPDPTPDNSPSLMDLLKEAVWNHKGRAYAKAESLYRQILARDPNHLDALNNLGAALQESNRADEAIPLLQKAVWLNPTIAAIHHNLGNALFSAGRFLESIDYHRRAIELDPNQPEFHNALANSLKSTGRLTDAISEYQAALKIRPLFPKVLNNLAAALLENGDVEQSLATATSAVNSFPKLPQLHNTLGSIFKAQNKLTDALASYRRAIALKPDYADAHNNLGLVLQATGAIDESITAFQTALTLQPDFAQAQNNLGYALKDKGLLDQAKAAFEKSLELDPKLISGHLNLALFHRERGNLNESVHWYKKALDLEPNNPITLNGLANTEKDLGNLDQAISLYRQALAINPNSVASQSNLLYTLHFHPDYGPRAILREHLDWAILHALPLQKEIQPLTIEPIANRRLRVGYVSPDFRTNVVGRCLLPLLANHDRTQFEIFAYTDVRHPDSLTDQLRLHCDHWHSTIGMTNSDLAEKIRADKIDILVDLVLHASGTRLLAFARKPAPIQLTWLAYPSTSGLTTIDYRLSDPYLDPPGTDIDYVEKTIRLPKTYWCYQPAGPTPDVAPLPAESNGLVTFGCLNKFTKISPLARKLWSALLLNIPNSRIFLFVPPDSRRDRAKKDLTATGVSETRISFFPGGPWETYMQQYNQIDIALDPFPHAGGITTCDALYMGVPVVTLLGQTAVGRGGASILSNLNLQNLIAKTPDDYLKIATELAGDLPRLTSLRQSLRPNMQSSPLMDAPTFAKDIESIYRTLAQNR